MTWRSVVRDRVVYCVVSLVVQRPVVRAIQKRVSRQNTQEVCPWNQRFAEVAAERDYAAREAWDAEWDSDPDDPDDDGIIEALIPTTDGPALVDLMRMSEDEWDANTRGSGMRRAGYAGLRRNVAIALGNWLAGSDEPDPEAIGELVGAPSDEDPIVAEAAAWALGSGLGPGR